MFGPEFAETRPDEYHIADGTRSGGARIRLEETLVSVWRQTLVDKAERISVNGRHFPVRSTPNRHWLQVDFSWSGDVVRGLAQNPETSSRWAQLAREGHRVMEFLSRGQYIGTVIDGKVAFYGHRITGLNR